MSDVDAIVFDLGNVLVEIDFERALASWARDAAVPIEQLRTQFAADEPYEAFERGEILEADYCEHLRGALGIALSDEALVRGWNAIFISPLTAVTAVLPALATQVPVFGFSNTNVTHQRHWSGAYATELAPLRHIFVSSDMGVRKPERAAFDRVTDSVGCKAERILFFDDSSANIAGAREAGWQAVHTEHPTTTIRELLANALLTE